MQHSVLLSMVAAADHPLIDIDLTAVLQFGIFAVTFSVASALVFRPYLRLRDQRTAGIEGARQDAVRLSAEANARLADYERRLEAARARAQEERRKIRTDATTIHREVTEMAKAKASSAVGHAREKLQRDMESIRTELLPRAERLAADIASKLLGREVA